MPELNIAELKRLIENLETASKALMQFMSRLNRDTIVDPDRLIPIPCDPIIHNPNPPTVARVCEKPAFLAEEPVTVGNFHDSLEKIDTWIRDINDIASSLDPNIPLS